MGSLTSEQLQRGVSPILFSTMIGSDPEIFAKDSKGKVIPAYEWMPLKAGPLTYSCVYAGGPMTAYYDGFQAEFTTAHGICHGYGVDRVRWGLKLVYDALRKKDATAKLSLDSCPFIGVKTRREALEEHIQLGCDPSKNIYGIQGKPVLDPRTLRYRFAGGHLHVSGFVNGYDRTTALLNRDSIEKNSDEFYKPYIKALDAVLGVYMVGVAASFDNPKRRMYYGLAGEYRTPPHGLEYRVLSNIWIAHPGLAHVAYGLCRAVVWMVANKCQQWWIADEEEVVETINKCDVVNARKILKVNETLLKYMLTRGIAVGPGGGNVAYDMAMNGLESIIKEPENFAKNWYFNNPGELDKWIRHCGALNTMWGSLAGSHLASRCPV